MSDKMWCYECEEERVDEDIRGGNCYKCRQPLVEMPEGEDMKADMRDGTKERRKKMDELTEASKPLIKFLCDKFHPHVKAIVEPTGVEVLEGSMSNPKIHDYLRD